MYFKHCRVKIHEKYDHFLICFKHCFWAVGWRFLGCSGWLSRVSHQYSWRFLVTLSLSIQILQRRAQFILVFSASINNFHLSQGIYWFSLFLKTTEPASKIKCNSSLTVTSEMLKSSSHCKFGSNSYSDCI